jgi:hypothetical protein
MEARLNATPPLLTLDGVSTTINSIYVCKTMGGVALQSVVQYFHLFMPMPRA